MSCDGREPIWAIEPHTKMKHFMLRNYLGAWLPKLALSGHRRIVFIDGFAGPGIYEGGEEGSPIVALRTAIEHKADLSGCEIVMAFIERCPDRFASLERVISALSIPGHVRAEPILGTFEDLLGGELEDLAELGEALAPSFVMIDPFGWTGYPMSLVESIGSHAKSEVLVTFMYQAMNRFWENPEQSSGFDALFGTDDWRSIADEPTPEMKRQRAVEIYRRQLNAAGFSYAYAFEMRDKGNLVLYYLVHATKHLDGLSAMKRAMWKADPNGTFRFSDYEASRRARQLALFGGGADPVDVERVLVGEFAGKGWIDVNVEMREYILTRTRYHDGHYKRNVLGRMQREGRLLPEDVTRPEGRKGTYWGSGTQVRLS